MGLSFISANSLLRCCHPWAYQSSLAAQWSFTSETSQHTKIFPDRSRNIKNHDNTKSQCLTKERKVGHLSACDTRRLPDLALHERSMTLFTQHLGSSTSPVLPNAPNICLTPHLSNLSLTPTSWVRTAGNGFLCIIRETAAGSDTCV